MLLDCHFKCCPGKAYNSHGPDVGDLMRQRQTTNIARQLFSLQGEQSEIRFIIGSFGFERGIVCHIRSAVSVSWMRCQDGDVRMIEMADPNEA